MFEQFTYKAEQAFLFAEEEAVRVQKQQVDIRCLLVGLARVKALSSLVLNQVGITPDKIRNSDTLTDSEFQNGQIEDCILGRHHSDEISRIVSGTQFVSSKLSANYIGTEHLLLAILLNDSGAELVKELGVDADALCLVVLRLLSQRGLDPETLRLPE